MGAYSYSGTAASNTTVDGIGAQGSDDPRNIDNLVRTLAASDANLVRDLGGSGTVTGTADAIALALNDASTASLFDGMIFSFRASGDNTVAGVTLAVDGLTAKTIKKSVAGVETALVAGDIQAGATCTVVYRSAWASAAGAFELLNPYNVAFGTISSGGALSPSSNDGAALGSASVSWSDLFLASGGVINWNNGDVTATHSANALAFAGASSGYTFDAVVGPATNDAAALGSATVSWGDLFLASGGVINWGNGALTATHNSGSAGLHIESSAYTSPFRASNTADNATNVAGYFASSRATPTNGDVAIVDILLNNSIGAASVFGRLKAEATDVSSVSRDGALILGVAIAGGTSDKVRLEGSVFSPAADDGTALGSTTYKWADLFLASGGVINFNNGDYVLTHSSNLLSGTGGIFKNAYASSHAIEADRLTDDGLVLSIAQAGTSEGGLSVSGTTVSLTGGHLGRWAQWDGSPPNPLPPRGTIVSNVDAMCEFWQAIYTVDGVQEKKELYGDFTDGQAVTVDHNGTEYPATVHLLPNDQLNKMIVSNVAGDKNVAGVVDFYDEDGVLTVAQSGDYVIRIAPGVVVQRGDLLESNGDGCARPQTDDIVRSKTVAKVSSTMVSQTYADGSYLVPCVLMAGG